MVVTLRERPQKIGIIDIAQALKDLPKNTDKLREAGCNVRCRRSSAVLTYFKTRCDVLNAEIRHQGKMIEQSHFHRASCTRYWLVGIRSSSTLNDSLSRMVQTYMLERWIPGWTRWILSGKQISHCSERTQKWSETLFKIAGAVSMRRLLTGPRV